MGYGTDSEPFPNAQVLVFPASANGCRRDGITRARKTATRARPEQSKTLMEDYSRIRESVLLTRPTLTSNSFNRVTIRGVKASAQVQPNNENFVTVGLR